MLQIIIKNDHTMKKTIITLAIIFGLGIGAFAQGGLFQYSAVSDEAFYGSGYDSYNIRESLMYPGLPVHGQDSNTDAPLGGGVLLLLGFGAAYAMKKRREE